MGHKRADTPVLRAASKTASSRTSGPHGRLNSEGHPAVFSISTCRVSQVLEGLATEDLGELR